MDKTAFEKAQQELVDSFKSRLTDALENVMSTFYCDISPHAETDAHTNFKNALWDEIYADFKKEIASEYSYHSRAATLRMDLLKNHKEEISNKIIEDLQEQVKSMKEHIDQLRRYR